MKWVRICQRQCLAYRPSDRPWLSWLWSSSFLPSYPWKMVWSFPHFSSASLSLPSEGEHGCSKLFARNMVFCRSHWTSVTVKRAQFKPWKWERSTKSPSIMTAIKYLQAVISSSRGSRNAPKKLLSSPRGIYTQNKGWIYTSKLVLHKTNSGIFSLFWALLVLGV